MAPALGGTIMNLSFSADLNIGRGGGSSRIGHRSTGFGRSFGEDGDDGWGEGEFRRIAAEVGEELLALDSEVDGEFDSPAGEEGKDGCDFRSGGAGEGPSTSEFISVSVDETSESSMSEGAKASLL